MGGCSGGGAGGGALAGARAVVDLGRGPQLTVRGAPVLSVVLSVLPAGVRHPDVLHHLLLSVGGRNLLRGWLALVTYRDACFFNFGVRNPISHLLFP